METSWKLCFFCSMLFIGCFSNLKCNYVHRRCSELSKKYLLKIKKGDKSLVKSNDCHIKIKVVAILKFKCSLFLWFLWVQQPVLETPMNKLVDSLPFLLTSLFSWKINLAKTKYFKFIIFMIFLKFIFLIIFKFKLFIKTIYFFRVVIK